MNITYSECVSATLDIQHVQRMRCVILLPVACQALQCLSTLPHTLQDFWKTVTEHKTVFEFYVYFGYILHSDKI
jgi:hypothetical protein